jgi:LacI family transcriptional regulator
MVQYPYFSQLVGGAAEALYEQDMRLVLCPTLHEHEREVTLLERLMHGTTDGALMILPEESSDELEALLNHGYRFVVIDPMMPLNERIPAVSAAHAAGADLAMQHLLSLGHTRIG